ncbi:hypothetical protein EsH8_IX_000468 [Colletotrichum jinshuiense]
MPNRQPLFEIVSNTELISRPQKKPHGKTSTPITKRTYATPSPVQRPQRTYSRRKRIDVLMYLEHHRYPIEAWPVTRQRAGDTPLDPADGVRRPTFDEAADHFKIPRTTVVGWYKQRDTIVNPAAKKPTTARATGQK